MVPQTTPTQKPAAWQVLRHFDGDKTPERLLQALIQAHQS